MMIASEVAKLAGVSAEVVRYYSKIGLLDPARNPDNGYRIYQLQDINRVRFIRKAKWLGFTLKDVRTILEEADSGHSPCCEVRRIISE
ncbi:MAG: MerR family transcriptional regulator, partial [Gammaproteobacteria bacterium]|nr:MerR family transcriptional regulator [Gammaproteobacteria bacterium]